MPLNIREVKQLVGYRGMICSNPANLCEDMYWTNDDGYSSACFCCGRPGQWVYSTPSPPTRHVTAYRLRIDATTAVEEIRTQSDGAAYIHANNRHCAILEGRSIQSDSPLQTVSLTELQSRPAELANAVTATGQALAVVNEGCWIATILPLPKLDPELSA